VSDPPHDGVSRLWRSQAVVCVAKNALFAFFATQTVRLRRRMNSFILAKNEQSAFFAKIKEFI
jgi:hypothetical protein